MNSTEERVYGYLIQFIGSLKPDDLRCFLQFITGSSVLLSTDISVVFDAASGLSRVITSHTCSGTIKIPTTYVTYLDFVHDFHCILDSDVGWIMDAL